MTNRQENSMTMFNVVVEVCDEHIDLITPIPAMLATVNLLKAKLLAAQDLARDQTLRIKGVAEDKLVLRKKLAKHAAIIARVMRAFARSQGNHTLLAEVDYSKTKLMKMRDMLLKPHCEIIYERAVAHAAALTDCGITAEMLLRLRTAIDEYDAHVADTTVAANDRKIATAQLKAQIKGINDLLKNGLDLNMCVFILTQPRFYSLYTRSRNVIDSAATKKREEV